MNEPETNLNQDDQHRLEQMSADVQLMSLTVRVQNTGQVMLRAADLIKTMKKYEDLPPITGVKTKL